MVESFDAHGQGQGFDYSGSVQPVNQDVRAPWIDEGYEQLAASAGSPNVTAQTEDSGLVESSRATAPPAEYPES